MSIVRAIIRLRRRYAKQRIERDTLYLAERKVLPLANEIEWLTQYRSSKVAEQAIRSGTARLLGMQISVTGKTLIANRAV